MDDFQPFLLEMEQRGLVTRTFRRLDPDRQQAVLAAVLEEAGESGPADLNIKKVAARAGVSVGSLYQYFGSRTTLLDFAIEIVVKTTVEMFDSYRDMLAAMPLNEAVPAYLSGGIEWSQQQTAVARFFASAAYQGDARLTSRVVRPIADSMREMVEAMLWAAQARGELRSDLDIPAVARVLNTLLIAVGDAQLLPHLNQYFQLTGGEVTVERVMPALLDLISRGLAPGAAG